MCRTFHLKQTEEYTSASTAHGIISRKFLIIGFLLSHGITINNVNHTKYGICHPNHVNWNNNGRKIWKMWWTGRPGVLQFMGSQRVGHDWDWTEWTSGFPYFLEFKSEFGNKEFIMWATVSSWSCFCWLYRVSPSLTRKNWINRILVLTLWRCPCVGSLLVLLKEGVSYDQCILLAKLC